MRQMVVRILKIVVPLVVVALAVFGGFVVYVVSTMPSSQGPRLAHGPEMVGVLTSGAYAWIVETDTGVLLIDSGMEADAILAELEERGKAPADVHTILLTHAHGDHVGGLPAFPEARVIVGPGETAMMTGEAPPQGRLASVFERMMGRPEVTQPMREAADGEVLELDGATVTVVHLPGHTPGSVAYLWRDVLFTGDAVLVDDGEVMVMTELFSNDQEQAATSVERLKELEFQWIADGHAGLHDDAHTKVLAFLAD